MIPSLSHERITEAETLASSATSPIFRYPWRVFAGADFDGARPVWVRVLKVSLDNREMDSLTLRDYSKVRCCCKRIVVHAPASTISLPEGGLCSGLLVVSSPECLCSRSRLPCWRAAHWRKAPADELTGASPILAAQ